VPCSGWYEWRDEGGKRKQKYLFNSSDNEPMLMAGIWFENDDIAQLVTLTTVANESCSKIHKRMPVIIKPEDIKFWFASSSQELRPLIDSRDVNSIAISAVS